jgi:formate-dependent nitrite reductase cytochrome c552 subunit
MRLGEFREVKEIKNVEKKKPSNYLINELNKYFDEIDSEDSTDTVMSKLDMIKGTSPEQLEEITRQIKGGSL